MLQMQHMISGDHFEWEMEIKRDADASLSTPLSTLVDKTQTKQI